MASWFWVFPTCEPSLLSQVLQDASNLIFVTAILSLYILDSAHDGRNNGSYRILSLNLSFFCSPLLLKDTQNKSQACYSKSNCRTYCCSIHVMRVPWTTRSSNQSILKEILNIHWKDWCWSWNSNTVATSCKELPPWKRPWCWERLKAGEGVTEDEMVGWHHRLNGHEFE